MEFYPYALPYSRYPEFIEICPPNEYRVTRPDLVPRGLPTSLLNKCNNAVVMTSGSQLHHTVFVVNFTRIDHSKLDQNPYILWFDHETQITTGGFIHHGDWGRRTIALDPKFIGAIESSGIMAYYPYSERPEKIAGKLTELKINSHNAAFWNAVRAIGK